MQAMLLVGFSLFAVSVGSDPGAAVAGDDRGGSGLVSMSPTRVLDTRETSGGSGPVAPGSPVTVELSGVPASAAAAVVNVTATNAIGDGFFSVWDCDGAVPPTSNGNYVGIGTVAANMITAVSSDAEICVATGDAAADVLVDVMGYYPAGSGVVTVTPTRSLDTRTSSGGSGPVQPGSHVTATLDGIPADAAAAIVNITATNATADGFFTVWDCDGPVPGTSNGNYVGVSTIANSAITPIGDQSQVCVQTGDGAADILVDTVGYLTADSGYTAVSPARLLDTRDTDTPLAPGDTATITLADVPAGDTAIVNVTATNAQGNGYFTVWNCDGPAPGTSNGNYVGVSTIANSAIITPNTDQQICVRTGDAAAHIIIDTTGRTTANAPDPAPTTTTTTTVAPDPGPTTTTTTTTTVAPDPGPTTTTTTTTTVAPDPGPTTTIAPTTTTTTVPLLATVTGRVTVDGSTAADGIGGAAVLLQRDGSTIDETTSAATPAEAVGNYSFAGVPPGTYTVIAGRSFGYPPTIEQEVTVPAGGGTSVVVNLVFGNEMPEDEIPKILSITAGDGELLVGFEPRSEVVTNYAYSTDDGVTWGPVTSFTVNPFGNPPLQLTISTISGPAGTDLVNGTEYQVRIRADNALGTGTSEPMSGTPATTPPAPTIDSITGDDETLRVNFTQPGDGGSEITNYEYSTDDGENWTTPDPASPDSPLEITGLTNGETYQVRIRAVNAFGVSPASEEESATVPLLREVTGTVFGLGPGSALAPLAFAEVTFPAQSRPDGSDDDSLTVVTGSDGSFSATIRQGSYLQGVTPDRVTRTFGEIKVSATGYEERVFNPSGDDPLVLDTENSVLRVAESPFFDEYTSLNSVAQSADLGNVGLDPSARTVLVDIDITGASDEFTTELTATLKDGTVAVGSSTFDTPTPGPISVSNNVTGGSSSTEFLFSGVRPGSYTLEISGVGVQTRTESVTVGPGTGLFPLGLLSVAATTVTGQVTDGGTGDNSGIEDIKVELKDNSEPPECPIDSCTTTTDGDGHYSFVGVPSETYTVTATRGEEPNEETIGTTVEVIADDDPNFVVDLDFAAFAPTITEVAAGDATLTVSFDKPESDGGGAITNYEYSTDNGGTWRVRVTGTTESLLVITTTSSDNTDLSNGTEYQVRIRAVNDFGNGPASNMVSGTPATVPSAPTNMAVTATSFTLQVTFERPSDGGSPITGYQYQLNDDDWEPTDCSGEFCSFTISDLDPGTTYTVRVRAINAAGEGDEAEVEAETTISCAGGGECHVGDTGPGGGIVFFVAAEPFFVPGREGDDSGPACNTAGSDDTSTCRYLEVAPADWNGGSGDDPQVAWSGNTDALVGTEVGLGFGYQNTKKAVLQDNTAGRAVTLADGYTTTVSGVDFSDWFLPSKDELNELYIQRAVVGGFADGNYWSSSEANASNASRQSFEFGTEGPASKQNTLRVRPVRAF